MLTRANSSKSALLDLCEGNPLVNDGFYSHGASNAEGLSMSSSCQHNFDVHSALITDCLTNRHIKSLLRTCYTVAYVTLDVANWFQNIDRYLHCLSFRNEKKWQVVEINFQKKIAAVFYDQYHGCWWSGDIMTIRYGVGIVLKGYSGRSTRNIQTSSYLQRCYLKNVSTESHVE